MHPFLLDWIWFIVFSAIIAFCGKKFSDSLDNPTEVNFPMWGVSAAGAALLAVAMIFTNVVLPCFRWLHVFMKPLGSGDLPLVTAALITFVIVCSYIIILMIVPHLVIRTIQTLSWPRGKKLVAK